MAQPKRLSALDLVNQRYQGSSSGSDFLARTASTVAPQPTADTGSALGDFGLALKAGVQELPSVATGIADIGAGIAGFDRPVSRAADALGDVTGLDFDKWAQETREQYSPQTKAALETVRQASDPDAGFWEGLGQTTRAALENPRSIGVYAAEALPGTVAGGGVAGLLARGAAKGAAKQQIKRMADGPVQPAKTPLLARSAVAGGIGEGAVAGGYAMSGTDKSVDPQRAALGALATGAGVGALGGLGASVARKLGVSDVDLIWVNGRPQPVKGKPRRNLAVRMGLGAVAEGVFEELPQTAYETMVSNYVEGRNIFEGVGSDAAMGMLAGGVLGAGTNILGGRRNFEEPAPPPADGGTGAGTGTAEPDGPVDPKDSLVSRLPEEDLYSMWARSLDAAENYAEDPETLAKIREYQSAMRSEFAKRGLNPERVAEGVDYENYKKIKDRVELAKQKVRSATPAGGRQLEAAQGVLSTALAELKIAEDKNPDFVARLDEEVEGAAKQAYFDLVEQTRKLGKKVGKLPPRSLAKKDNEARDDLAALNEKIAAIGTENPAWEQEAAQILKDMNAPAADKKAEAAEKVAETQKKAEAQTQAVFDEGADPNVDNQEFLDNIPDFSKAAVEDTEDADAPVATIEPATVEPATVEPATVEPTTVEPTAEGVSVQGELEKAKRGVRRGTELTDSFLNEPNNSDDLAKAKKSSSVVTALTKLEAKLDTLDAGGARAALAAQQEARDKSEGKRTFASQDRKLKFIKRYMDEKGYPEESLATLKEAERQDPTTPESVVSEDGATTEVATVPRRTTDLGFVTTPESVQAPAPAPTLKQQAGAALESVTSFDLSEATTRMQTILGVTPKEMQVFQTFLEVVDEDPRNPKFGSKQATPWTTLAYRLKDAGYKGSLDTKNLRGKMRQLSEKYRQALKSVRPDIPAQVFDSIVTRMQAMEQKQQEPVTTNELEIRKLETAKEAGDPVAAEELKLALARKKMMLALDQWWMQADSDAPTGLSGNPFEVIRNAMPDPEAKVAGIWKNIYAPLADYLSKDDLLYLKNWGDAKRKLLANFDLATDSANEIRAVMANRQGTLSVSEALEKFPEAQEAYEISRSQFDPEGENSPTWDELLQQPEAAIKFATNVINPSALRQKEEEAQIVRDVLLQDGLEAAFEQFGADFIDNYGFDGLALQKSAYENDGAIDPALIDDALESWLADDRLLQESGLKKVWSRLLEDFGGNTQTEDQLKKRLVTAENTKVAINKSLLEGDARAAKLLDTANKNANAAVKEAAKAERAERQARIDSQAARLMPPNALPFEALKEHPMAQGVRNVNSILAQENADLNKPTLRGKVGPTLAAIARKELNPFTWVKSSKGKYETTLSGNDLMWTIRKSPTDSSVQQLWVVKDSPIGAVNESTDVLWAESNQKSGAKAREELRKVAKDTDGGMSYYSYNYEDAVAARAKERSRRRTEAQNKIADAVSGNDFSALAPLKESFANKPLGSMPVYIKKKSTRGEYGKARPMTPLTGVLYKTGAQIFDNGTPDRSRLQVIGDPRVLGSDNVVNALVHSDTFGMQMVEQDGVKYKAKLYWVTVPMDKVGDFLQSEANQVIQDEALAEIAFRLQNLEASPELDAAKAIAGPVLNYAEGKVKNLAHIKSLLNSGATEIQFATVVPAGQAQNFEKRLAEYTITPAAIEQSAGFRKQLRDWYQKRAEKRAAGRISGYNSYNHKPVGTPSTVAEVESVVAQAIPNLQGVKVVQSLADLANFAEQNGITLHPTTGGFVYQNRVYLIADNIDQGNALGVLLHEAGVHTSMPQSMVNAYADQIREAAQAGDPIAQAAVDRASFAAEVAAGQGAQIDIVALNQETVAYFVEESVNNFGVTPSQIGKAPSAVRSVLTKIMTYIRQAMASLGIRLGRLEAQSVVDVAFGMANNAIRRPMGRQEMLMSMQATSAAIDRASRAWEQAGEPGRARFKAFYDTVRTWRDRTVFGFDLGKMASTVFPQITAYNRFMRQGNAARGEVDAALQRLVDPFDKFSRGAQEQVNAFLKRTQYIGKWAFDPVQAGIQNPTKPQEIDPDLSAEFNALPAEQQAFIKSVFKAASDFQQQLHEALTAEIETRYDSLMENASAEDKIALLDQLKKDLRAHDATKSGRIAGWLPLRRHGQFAAVFMSDEMRALLERRDQEGGNNRETIEEIKALRADERHYDVRFFETRTDAQIGLDDMASDTSKAKGYPETFTREALVGMDGVVPAYMYNSLEASLRDAEVSSSGGERQVVTAKALRRAVTKMYIAGLADTNARKSELGREKTAGASGNMVRGFLDYGQSVGTSIASLTTGQKTADVLRQMRKESRKASPSMDRQRKSDLFAEIIHRHTASIDPDPTPTSDKVMGLTSVWMLLTSPAYYMQNATQPWLMTLPVIAGQFGLGVSSDALARNYSLVNKAWAKAHEGIVGKLARGDTSVWGGELADLEAIRAEIGEEAYEMLEDMKQQGVFDVGVSADFGNIYQSDSTTYTAKTANVLGRIHRKLVHGVRSVEVYNRGVTALAAYQLAKANPSNLPSLTDETGKRRKMTPQEYAFDVVMGTQGDYSGANAPSIIKRAGPLGKVMFQFRKFQLIQMTLFAGMLKRASVGADPMEKAVARRQLGYLFGANMMVGGLLALPAANLALPLVAYALGDEEEPDNFEMMLREYIGDPATADLILKGLPTLVDQDWSAKLGWGTTFSPLPYARLDMSRDTPYKVAGMLFLGPTGGALSNMYGGASMIADGNVAAGTMEMMPRGVRDVGRGYFLATKGFVDRSPYERVLIEADDVTGAQVFSQALGAPSATQTRAFSVNRGTRDAKQFFSDRSTEIKAAFVRARRNNDPQGVQEARRAWFELQAARVREGFPRQDISILNNALRDVKKAERDTRSGVAFDKSTRRYVERRL